MTKTINNRLYGHHFNSKYWQSQKSKLPPLPTIAFETAVGMVLGDATMYHVSREAYIKFEQGWKQKPFIDHLFEVFRSYSFMQQPRTRYNREQNPKSYWFKTFSFPDFTTLFQLFYEKKDEQQKLKWRKSVKKGVILDNLTARGLIDVSR